MRSNLTLSIQFSQWWLALHVVVTLQHTTLYIIWLSSQCCSVVELSCSCSQPFFSLSQAFQKELGKRAGCIRTLKRSVRDLTRSSTADAHWLQEQMGELEGRWDAVCKLSVNKQDRLEAALQQVLFQLKGFPYNGNTFIQGVDSSWPTHNKS